MNEKYIALPILFNTFEFFSCISKMAAVVNTSNVSNALPPMIAVSYGIIMTLGSIFNGLVAITYIKWRYTLLTKPKDVLILSLAIGDFAMASLVCPLGFASAASRKWTFGHAGCVWYGFISTWVGLASIVQLAILAIERYITLSNPSPNAVSTKRAIQAVLAAWTFAFVASCFPLVGWSEYTLEGFGFHCSILWETSTISNTTYCVFLLVVFYVIPVLAIGFSYTKIFFIVRHIYINADNMWGPDSRITKESYEAQVKTAKQLLLMTVGFMFAWTPYAVMSMLVLVSGTEISLSYREYPSLLAKTALIYNPVIYFFTYQNLRKKVVETLRGAGNIVRPI